MAKFVLLKCKCGNEQKVFGAAASKIRCRVCNETIALPTGGGIATGPDAKRIRDVE